MKAKSRKIGKVASVAAAEERRLGQLAGQARRRLEEQVDRLGELNAFRHNYAKKSASQSELRAAHWQDYQAFLSRLDSAVKAQQQIVREGERMLESHRQRWIEKRQKLESLERVLEKHQTEERVQEARREQKQLDDLPKGRSSFDGDD
ncbi:MAG: flagellar export protein FliJ [Woeseiaceae bacterium]